MVATRAGALGLVVVGLVGCAHEGEIRQRHAQTTTRINSQYQLRRQQDIVAWQAAIAKIDEQRSALIPVAPNSNYSPLRRIDHREDIKALWAPCASLDAFAKYKERLGRKTTEEREAFVKCNADYWRAYYAAVREASPRADFGAVARVWNASPDPKPDFEALMAYAHNSTVLGTIAEHRARAVQLRNHAIATLDANWKRDLSNAELAMNAEIEADREAARERARAVALAFASGMQAAGNSLQSQSQASQPSYAPPAPSSYSGAYSSGSHPSTSSYQATPATSAGSCSSDFSCGVGYRCVKPNFSATGTCAKTVNEYGVQQFASPSLNSIGVKTPVRTDCRFDTDCPVLFRCDSRSGACMQR